MPDKIKAPKKVKLVHKDSGKVAHCWPVDVAGWNKHGYFAEGQKVPTVSGEEMQKLTVDELKKVASDEGVGIKSDDKKADIINKILVSRQKADQDGAED